MALMATIKSALERVRESESERERVPTGSVAGFTCRWTGGTSLLMVGVGLDTPPRGGDTPT